MRFTLDNLGIKNLSDKFLAEIPVSIQYLNFEVFHFVGLSLHSVSIWILSSAVDESIEVERSAQRRREYEAKVHLVFQEQAN